MSFGEVIESEVAPGAWVRVPYPGDQIVPRWLAVSRGQPDDGDWKPAFVEETPEHGRVAMIRCPELPPRQYRVFACQQGTPVRRVGRITVTA